MPMSMSWVEELVFEYYILKGFTVNLDVSAGVWARGGRGLVAVNTINREVHVVEIANTSIEGPWRTIKGVVDRLNKITDLASKLYGQDFRYVKRAIILGEPWRPMTQRVVDGLKQEGIEACSLQDFILEIVRYVDEWRSEKVKSGIVKKGSRPMLPEGLCVLKLLEYMKDARMVHPPPRRS